LFDGSSAEKQIEKCTVTKAIGNMILGMMIPPILSVEKLGWSVMLDHSPRIRSPPACA
jgi:hypothetical protein